MLRRLTFGDTLHTVDESDFKNTPLVAALGSYIEFFGRTIQFFDVGTRALTVLSALTPIFAHPIAGALLGTQRWAQAIKTHLMGKREIDDGFEFFAALILLSSWAAFEAYIDDACKAVLQMDPPLLNQGNLSRVKLSYAESQLDQMSQFDVYLRKGAYLTNASTAVQKIERELKLVNLNGHVPQDLTDHINTSKLIRNVWAHNAGKADRYFVENSVNTPFGVGDTVTVSKESLTTDAIGMASYAIMILNRFRVAHGMQAAEAYPGTTDAPNPFKPNIDALFPNPISWRDLWPTA